MVSSSAPLANVQMRRLSWHAALLWTTWWPSSLTRGTRARCVPKTKFDREFCWPETRVLAELGPFVLEKPAVRQGTVIANGSDRSHARALDTVRHHRERPRIHRLAVRGA